MRPRRAREAEAGRPAGLGRGHGVEPTSLMAVSQQPPPAFVQPPADHALLLPASAPLLPGAPIRTTGSLAYEALCQQEAEQALHLLAQYQAEEQQLSVEM
eukprot:EG_transcript_63814